jgi:murein DD-endopeptidase MepM/ murein hydrolase activator NlpD
LDANVKEVSISSIIKRLATLIAVRGFRLVRAIKRGLQSTFALIGQVLAPAGDLFVRLAILPFYRLGVMLRLRTNRLSLPARGLALFFITNRYLVHAAVGGLTIATIVTNFEGRQAHAQDVGQKTLLFAMATDQQTELIEEEVRPELFVKDANYLGDATLSGIPHIDFDYEEDLDPIVSSITVPGTISAQPIPETEGESLIPRTRTETYTVQANDTISTIAQKFNVNIGTILWNNNLTERQFIRPGDTLKIPPVSGMIVTVKKGDTITKLASTYDSSANDITSFNNLSSEGELALGTELMIPGGRPPAIEQTRTTIAVRNESVTGRNPSITATTKPADLDTKTAPKTKLLWPVPGHVITQYYGWRHTGIDIDGDYSDAIYASEDGVVTTAGWNSGGYGLQMLIDHGNGIVTRYAHASKMFVKAGEKVKKGQVIAMVGTTGRSTGTHIHYEVYVNGKRQNPLVYIR